MEYNEQLAHEVIKKFNLDAKTAKVWKTRGKIPAKYFNPDYQAPQKADKAGKEMQRRILEVMEFGYINNRMLCQLANVYPQKYFDIRRGKTAGFNAEEITRLKKEINRLRLLIVKTFERRSEPALKQLLQNETLLIRPVLNAAGCNAIDYDRASRFRRSEYHLNSEDYETIKDAYIKAALQFSL